MAARGLGVRTTTNRGSRAANGPDHPVGLPPRRRGDPLLPASVAGRLQGRGLRSADSPEGWQARWLPTRIPHDFRRTAVRNLERAGVPRSAAMKMVGHKTEAIYRRYAIAEEKMLAESADKLDQFHAADQQPMEPSK